MVNPKRVRIIRKIIYTMIICGIFAPSVIIFSMYVYLESTMRSMSDIVDQLAESQVQRIELHQTALTSGSSTDTGVNQLIGQPEDSIPQTSSSPVQVYLAAQYDKLSVLDNSNGKSGDLANSTLTISEFSTMLNHAFGYDVLDAYENTLNTKNTNISAALGLMQDFIGQGVRASDEITREQAVSMLYRAFRLQAKSDVVTRFTDMSTVAPWAVDAVQALEQNGYLNEFGYRFSPQNRLTRGEAQRLLYEIYGTIIDKCTDACGNTYKNVTIRKPGVYLRNIVIDGDLYITEGIHNGNIWLENVRISGRLIIAGGRNIYTKGVTAGRNIFVDKPSVAGNDALRYYAVRSNDNVTVYKGSLKEIILSDNIILSCRSGSGMTVFNLFNPRFDEPQEIKLAKAVRVEKAAFVKPVRIQGGSIGKIEVHTNGVALDANTKISISNVEAEKGIKVSVGDYIVTGTGINDPIPIPASPSWPVITSTCGDTVSSGGSGSSSKSEQPVLSQPVPPHQYTVTVRDDGNGTAYAFPSNAAQGSIVSIVASPNGGYRFHEWEVVSGSVTLSNTTEHYADFVMPDSDVTIRAKFVPSSLVVTVQTDGGGIASAIHDMQTNTITIEADSFPPPNNRYVFDYWEVVNGNLTLSDATVSSATFAVPVTPVTIKANFKLAAAHTITIAKDATGSGDGSFRYGVNGGTLANYMTPVTDAYVGDTITVQAIPNLIQPSPAGSKFVEWRSEGNQVTFAEAANPTTTFKMPNENVTITAVFEPNPAPPNPPAQYTINMLNDGNGTAYSFPSNSVQGAVVSIVASPNGRYKFHEWEIVSGSVTLSSTTEHYANFEMPDSDVTIKAKFVPDLLTVTVQTDGGGTAYATHDPQTNTITVEADSFPPPNNRYVFDHWEVVSGNLVLSDATASPATFAVPITPVTIKANFRLASPHTVTIAKYATGSGDGSFKYGMNGGTLANYTVPVTNAYIGDIITIQALPSSISPLPAGSRFVEWRSEGNKVTFADATNPTTMFKMPNEDVTITAVFEPEPAYNITIGSNGNGTASANRISASKGTLITVTPTPDFGYVFDHWQVISGNVGSINIYESLLEFNMPASDVEIKAYFSLDGRQPADVTVSQTVIPVLTPIISTSPSYSERSAAITITGITGLDAGDTVTVSIAPNSYGLSGSAVLGSGVGSLTILYDGTTPVTTTDPVDVQLIIISGKYQIAAITEIEVTIIDGQAVGRAIPLNSTNFLPFNNYINSATITYRTHALTLNYKLTGNVTAGTSWTPIGTSSTYSFTGTFDGGNNTISSLTVNSGSYRGLFGYISGSAAVRNVTLSGVSISSGGNYIGGVVGYNSGGSVANCSLSGGSVSGGSYVGGVVGYNYNGSVTSCGNTGLSVTGSDAYVGGVIGYQYGGSVQYCYATGNVTGGVYVGGVVGLRSSGTLQQCYATGVITGNQVLDHDETYAGGLVGYNSGAISNCYATGNVSGAGNHVGGLAGEHASGIMQYCYASGNVSGTYYLGGIAGHNHATVRYCVALNNNVTGSVSAQIGRVVGEVYAGGSLLNNYAKAMTGPSVSTGATLNEKNGLTVTATNYNSATSASWWSGTAGFSTSVWQIVNSALPKLWNASGLQTFSVFLMLEPDIYTVTVTTDGGGTAVILPDDETVVAFNSGEAATVNAIPDEGYIFAQWIDDNLIAVSTEAEYSFVVTGDVTLTAVFKPQAEYTVTVDSNGGGMAVILPNGETEAVFSYGETVTVSAIPDENHVFVEWRDATGATISTDYEYSFTIEQDIILIAVFNVYEDLTSDSNDADDAPDFEPSSPQQPADVPKEDEFESDELNGDDDEDHAQNADETSDSDTDDISSPEPSDI